MHGQYIKSTDRQLVREGDTFLWLSRGDLKGENNSEIIAALDQALQTKYNATKILPTTDSKYRLSKQFDETVEHIIPTYPILSKEECILRHDGLCAELHFNIRKEKGVKLDDEHRYEHAPKLVETIREGKITVLWNQQVRSERIIPNNKPDIIIHDNKEGTCMLIDAAIPGERNVIKKKAERILKYEELIIEIQCMWTVRAKVIPLITGATGTISKSLRQYLSKRQEGTKLRNYKNSRIGHCRHTTESVNVKAQNIFHG